MWKTCSSSSWAHLLCHHCVFTKGCLKWNWKHQLEVLLWSDFSFFFIGYSYKSSRFPNNGDNECLSWAERGEPQIGISLTAPARAREAAFTLPSGAGPHHKTTQANDGSVMCCIRRGTNGIQARRGSQKYNTLGYGSPLVSIFSCGTCHIRRCPKETNFVSDTSLSVGRENESAWTLRV